ncbi:MULTISPECIES: arylesterase [unclassified Lentimonas]|uniref:arylesterase n=1 Tax=unclassified Lentimonas TaxID=2630993 RepID=UPI0013230704|nr:MULTISPECIES: arylesterase [unclassified Lentimonas]CAA6696888.1 Arylesterase precursor (EC [Lentimonas sp. CC19]CAA6697461.1 Arylesterase precursor (EC [Lentimonas sp. CC10]CAA7071158.1 Arylesterase precursor (EC [Lentimonas sp. CC11]
MSANSHRFRPFFKCLARLCGLLVVLLNLPTAHAEESPTQILFFGDSLTAGYGIDPELAYPALIQKKIDAAGIAAEVTVGAVSGDTSAGGLRRIDWMLRKPVDIFVLALGANDGLRGTNTEATAKNLQAIIDKVKARAPQATIVVAGMRLPPSLGTDYTDAFAAIYPALAEANDAALIPFLLEGVGGEIELNLADRIHPNAAGHEIVSETVWRVLSPIL